MNNDRLLKDLLLCMSTDGLDSKKFLSTHPLTESLKKELVSLKNLGFIKIEYGDDTILDICEGHALVKLFESQ